MKISEYDEKELDDCVVLGVATQNLLDRGSTSGRDDTRDGTEAVPYNTVPR